MAQVGRRVALGTAAGGVVWSIWSSLISFVFLMPKYRAAQTYHELLAEPRYHLFVLYWYVTLFLLTYIMMWVYVSVRRTLGPGPLTAARIGILMGFVAAFPLSLTLATWATFSRGIVLGWMLDLWIGAILATLVSAWLYKES